MIRVDTSVKVYKVPDWNGHEYGKIQISSKALASSINLKKRVVLFVLDDNDEIPTELKVDLAKGKYCKACKLEIRSPNPLSCPFCGHLLQ